MSDYDDEKPLKLVNKNQKYCKNKNDSFLVHGIQNKITTAVKEQK